MNNTNTGLIGSLLGNDTQVTIDVKLDDQSIVRLCVGLLLVFVVILLVYGIIKKSI